MAFNPNEYLMKVQGGKMYLPVAARVLWFRTEHPDWGIHTEALVMDTDKQLAVFHASIFNAEGKLMASATKAESIKGFPDYIEKAETGAVGRALAYCGFGTQFCGGELEEGFTVPPQHPAPPPPAQRRQEQARQREQTQRQAPPPSDEDDPNLADPFEEPQVDPDIQARNDASVRFVAALRDYGLPVSKAEGRPGEERKAIIQWALRRITGVAESYDLTQLPPSRIAQAAKEIAEGKRPGLLDSFKTADANGEFGKGAQSDGS